MRCDESMRGICSAIKILCKISRVFCIIGLVCIMLCSIMFLAMPKDSYVLDLGFDFDFRVETNLDVDLNGDEDIVKGEGITVGNNFIESSDMKFDIVVNNYHIGVVVWGTALDIAASYFVLLLVGKIFESLAIPENKIFTQKHLEMIKKLGIALAIWKIAVPFLSSVLMSIMFDSNLNTTFGGIDLSLVICVLIYIFFVKLFGALAKKESEGSAEE
ncbi:MAG: hypothetical protein E7623_06850 [Ruminococcaceae bacterium]|nr:hypothetical protein [Oscillospiraceae bacterium]